MKFFTPEWWGSGGTDPADAVERYADYFNSVREHLPTAAVLIDTEYTLHDARVRRVRMDALGRHFLMVLDGWDRDFASRSRYTLRFAGVSLLEQGFPTSEPRDPELGDLGYWEWERLTVGFEMRMLFASSAEWVIQFSSLAFDASRPETEGQ